MKLKVFSIPIIIFLLALFLACSNEDRTMDIEKEREVIEKVMEEYSAAANNGDATAYAALFADDLLWAPPNAPVVRSKAELKNTVETLFNKLHFELKENPIEVEVFGDFAYLITDATGTITPKDGTDKIPINNTAILIFRKQNGIWKISRELYNNKGGE